MQSQRQQVALATPRTKDCVSNRTFDLLIIDLPTAGRQERQADLRASETESNWRLLN